MDDGKIIESGNHEKLMNDRGTYYSMFTAMEKSKRIQYITQKNLKKAIAYYNLNSKVKNSSLLSRKKFFFERF